MSLETILLLLLLLLLLPTLMTANDNVVNEGLGYDDDVSCLWRSTGGPDAGCGVRSSELTQTLSEGSREEVCVWVGGGWGVGEGVASRALSPGALTVMDRSGGQVAERLSVLHCGGPGFHSASGAVLRTQLQFTDDTGYLFIPSLVICSSPHWLSV